MYNIIKGAVYSLWHISAVQFGARLQIRGTVIKGRCPQYRVRMSMLRKFLTTGKTFFMPAAAHIDLEIEIDGRKWPVSTGSRGSFVMEVPATHPVQPVVYRQGDRVALPVCQTYPSYFPDTDFPLAVISDVDDTILVSYTRSLYKRIRTLLFVSPHKRKPVSFTLRLLQAVAGRQGRIFYISKSESNLFGLLSNVIMQHQIPAGPLYLTTWTRFLQLIRKKAADYKLQHILNIIRHSPGKQFILLGDDTQQDMRVYADVVVAFPQSIYKIYIRKTRKSLSSRKQAYLARLQALPVPVVYFSDSDAIGQDLHDIENYQG